MGRAQRRIDRAGEAVRQFRGGTSCGKSSAEINLQGQPPVMGAETCCYHSTNRTKLGCASWASPLTLGASKASWLVAGQMKVELHRSGIGAGIGADQLTLIITLPNGREFVAHAPRDELKD